MGFTRERVGNSAVEVRNKAPFLSHFFVPTLALVSIHELVLGGARNGRLQSDGRMGELGLRPERPKTRPL